MTPRTLTAALAAGLLALPAAAQPQPVGAAAAAALDGTWQVVSAMEDGTLVGHEVLRDQFVKDGRVRISSNTLTLTPPGRITPREVAFVLNPTTAPRTIDLAGAQNTGTKGIYMRDGDSLLMCLGGPGSSIRPTEFTSPPGSGRILLTFQRVSEETPIPPPPPPPAPHPIPPPVAPLSGDAVLRGQLTGTWGYQDDQSVVYNTLNPDGTFSSMTTWKKGIGRMFKSDVRTSGTWKVESGSLVCTATASTDKDLRGQIMVMRIYTIDDREVVFTDVQNRLRREWKVR